MAETTPAGATPAAGGATPPQTPANGSQPDADAQPATGAQDGDPALGAGGTKALRAEREARADAERRAKTAEDELGKLRDANLTEGERRDKRLAELERRDADHERERQDWRLREAVMASAQRLGYRNPSIAFSLIDRAALEYDEGGEPKNVDRLLGDLATAEPYLTGSARGGSFDGGPRGKTTGGQTFDEQIRRAAGRA